MGRVKDLQGNDMDLRKSRKKIPRHGFDIWEEVSVFQARGGKGDWEGRDGVSQKGGGNGWYMTS